MLDTIEIEPGLWPTSALIDWIGILQRMETEQRDAPRRAEQLKEALGLLRARLNFQGTVMTFSTERSDALWWLMVSTDVNANRALIAVLDEPGWREDVGRLVRGALSRQKRGRWGTTVANAWGTVAVARFAEAFEKTPATGQTTISLGEKSVPVGIAAEQQTRDFDWPAAKRDAGAAAPGQRRAVGDRAVARRAAADRAALHRVQRSKRTVTPVEQKDKAGYSRGDVYRVSLEIEAQADMTWVVVDDPIPAGAMILGSGLGRRRALRSRRARSAKGGRGPHSSSARTRRIAPTTNSCRRAGSGSSTRCASTTRAGSICPRRASRRCTRRRCSGSCRMRQWR